MKNLCLSQLAIVLYVCQTVMLGVSCYCRDSSPDRYHLGFTIDHDFT